MIGSFWNLCRACPSMPVDKLHSEYRSTYRWHEYTGPRQEVVRRPPQATGEKTGENRISSRQEDDVHSDLPKLEPAMPRRKKYPDLAYRHNEFLVSDGEVTANGGICNQETRARSEQRGPQWRPSRRSKSEGPRRGAPGDGMRERERRRESDPDLDNMGRDTGLLRKAISKISTEYRLQFAWPQGHISRRDAVDGSSTPRKSKSMGAIKPAANAMIHKKRIDGAEKDASELEPLVDGGGQNNHHREDKTHIFKDEFNTEYKKKFRPFSQYEYSEGRFTATKRGVHMENHDEGHNSLPANCNDWYGEVVELRKKAGEYKNRGWGTKFAPPPNRLSDNVCNKQVELWDQVSRRSTLSALSLASMTHKSYTKEEKEVDNNNKTSPTKVARNAENSTRIMRDMIKHHLERTTGGSELDGLILSPTREKLEPTIPRKDDDSRGSQKNSPKKNSPLKSSSLKRQAQKSKAGLKNMRSQSVGPTTETTGETKRSPKRQSRSATVKERKSSSANPPPADKRPRPSSLNTTASSRSKHSSVAPKNEADDRLAKVNHTKSQYNHDPSSLTRQKLGSKLEKGSTGADQHKDTNESTSEHKNSAPEVIDYAPVVKSPPEPTRVKSPEQILMRSPDPVNWTVPLDTGKTFTVTQNVRDGDIGSRPQSEVKAWTPPEVPPPVAQSAPPALTEQNKEQGMSYGFSSESMNSGRGRVIPAQLRDLYPLIPDQQPINA